MPSAMKVYGGRASGGHRATPSIFQSRWLMLALVVMLVALGSQLLRGKAASPSSIGVRLESDSSAEQLSALAERRSPQDVLLYGASWCPNCAAAKQWMSSHGFRYQECDVEKSPSCTEEFRRLGADGVPYLVVRGHHMKDGFDSDEFVAALSR